MSRVTPPGERTNASLRDGLLVVEMTVRLALSHLLMPSAPPEQAVKAMLAVARTILPEEG